MMCRGYYDRNKNTSFFIKLAEELEAIRFVDVNKLKEEEETEDDLV